MDLYGLIHERYILSSKGLHKMRNKFLNGTFGGCPRVLCERQLVVPIAMSEDLSISRVKIFCPRCEEVYVPRIRFVDIDGAYFGCSFPNIFFQTFPELLPTDKQNKYIPKIYGFRLYGMPGSKYEKNINEQENRSKSESNK
jgi:casein kinase II subunit beta